MSVWRGRWETFGALTYGLAARLAGQLLGLSGCLESVLLHRSVATGEVYFGRSDLDLMLLLRPDSVDGRRLATLLRLVRRVQWIVPVMLHREVYPPGSMADFAQLDTVWASMESRCVIPVYGGDARPPRLPVNPEHALRRLLVWWELFFTQALWGRSGANREKACLECWNFFAVAVGLLDEPLLRRSEMKEHLHDSGGLSPALREREGARRFLLELIATLHRQRRPPLSRLARPVMFETVLAPHGVARRFIVLPEARDPLPAGCRAGDLVATPELLDLFTQLKNVFMHWSLPPELVALGLNRPPPEAYLRDGLYLSAANFLFLPGFGARWTPHPGTRLDYVAMALEALERGEDPSPPPVPLQKVVRDAQAYYLQEYDELERRRVDLVRQLRARAKVEP